ncbi:aminoglycoside phosphotransferase [Actinokineospora enzanensis]|uniref:aminoglycoside phosphotransferase n=1 Tax=Actinokineospora enzanensis TaxID=155975 RepID=UPI00039E7A50|nr:aminoglycoside phosphotransferase [Actinokineospora enzanensis]
MNTYDMRSAGTVASDGDADVWLRVVVEDLDYQPACRWEGNVEANAITGVPKPRVLRWKDWENHEDYLKGRRVRAEVMTLAPGRSVSPDAVLFTDPELPDTWWSDLRNGLAALAAHPVPQDDPVDSIGFVARGVAQHFDRQLDPEQFGDLVWVTSHADLHWGNLVGPELSILDWESWRRAPAGYDAATLYCNSLLIPNIAERVQHTFADVLDTPTGHFALLFAVVRYLAHIGSGSDADALEPSLRPLGESLLSKL